MTLDTAYRHTPELDQALADPLRAIDGYHRRLLPFYLYARSRVLVTARAYDEEQDRGTLSVGSDAHLDILDLDVMLVHASDEVRADALVQVLKGDA